MNGIRRIVACGLTMFVVVACGASGNDDLLQDLQGLNFGKYLVDPAFHPELSHSGDWDVYTYSTDELRCVTGSEYFLMVRQGLDPQGTVLWLEGGGACWPGQEDCSTEAQIYDWIEEYGLASSNANNPVRDWNFVYVPYCDGSLHAGDSQADYDGDGVVDHWHWGMRSTSAAVRLIAELFPESERILVAGCSAGGGGTLWATPVVRLQFPKAGLYVLSIAGLALINPSRQETTQTIEETWNVGQFRPADCPQCDQQTLYFFSWLLERDSALRVGVFSSLSDVAARSRWGLSAEEFQTLMLSTTSEIHAAHPDTFQRFFIQGEEHCLADYAYSVEGISFWEWVGYLIDESPQWLDLVE